MPSLSWPYRARLAAQWGRAGTGLHLLRGPGSMACSTILVKLLSPEPHTSGTELPRPWETPPACPTSPAWRAQAVTAVEARQEAVRRLNEPMRPATRNISPARFPPAHARVGRLTVCAILPLA